MSGPSSDSKKAMWEVGSIATPVNSSAFEASIAMCGAVTLLWALSNVACDRSTTYSSELPSDGTTICPVAGSAAAESGSSPSGAVGLSACGSW